MGRDSSHKSVGDKLLFIINQINKRKAVIITTVAPQCIHEFVPLSTNLLKVLVGVSIPAMKIGVEVCTEALLGECCLDGFPLPELSTWTFRVSIGFNSSGRFTKRILRKC